MHTSACPPVEDLQTIANVSGAIAQSEFADIESSKASEKEKQKMKEETSRKWDTLENSAH